MIQLRRQDILVHQNEVPWPELYQVEQDLLLCMAMVKIFNHPQLRTQVAMRGGTVLHKIHLAPASRYSEDIDLVVVDEDVSEEAVKANIQAALSDLFGEPKNSVFESLRLAARNLIRPSKIWRCIYEVPSVANEGQTLKIEVEVNLTERVHYMPTVKLAFTFPFRKEEMTAEVVSFDINEMLGTKMRALFQRSKGRDLFDLYWALNHSKIQDVDAAEVVRCFRHYMDKEDISHADFLQHLDENMSKKGFRSDMDPLLLSGLTYDISKADVYVRNELLSNLKAPAPAI